MNETQGSLFMEFAFWLGKADKHTDNKISSRERAMKGNKTDKSKKSSYGLVVFKYECSLEQRRQ